MNIGFYGAEKPEEKILTMAFVNFQPLDKIYATEDAFNRGTLFPNLDKPFLAAGDMYEK